jgi:hypothetical protein
VKNTLTEYWKMRKEIKTIQNKKEIKRKIWIKKSELKKELRRKERNKPSKENLVNLLS